MSKAQADKYFSIYIRLRDTDENGYGKCISSNQDITYWDSDCGHFVNRRHNSLRYNEINCNAQCRGDNRFDEGNIPGYSVGITKKYGEGIIEKLLAMKHTTLKLDKFTLKQIAKEYKSKCKELLRTKNFTVNL